MLKWVGELPPFSWRRCPRERFLIDHFDLFGWRQVFAYANSQSPMPPTVPPPPALYKLVRHPLMPGFLIDFGFTPTTWGHLPFAGVTTGNIFVGVFSEERDMKNAMAGATRNIGGWGCWSRGSGS